MSEQITITRRSKIGFGYTANVENDERGNLVVCDVKRPDYTGTILSVQKMIASDRTLDSFRSGGTYYRTAWFVKIDGVWKRLVESDHNNYELSGLTEMRDNMFGESGYYQDAVTVEVE